MVEVDTQFVQVGERRVFVRHAGRGAAVVLVHQSPESSVSLLPWFAAIDLQRFAVFAPDTPGFGLSDPLPLAQPTIPDLAEALGRFVEALQIGPVLLYGVHTGAAIAARLARDRPALVAALVCDGLSAFTADERAPLLDGYLPPFEPVWDGTHLLWLWARMREQKLYFPWHVGTAATRIPYPLPTAAEIHKEAMELLDAGDGYRAGYRAPLLYEHGAAGAAQIGVPARLLYRRADVLRPHLDRLPALPAHVAALEVPDAAALRADTLAHFERHAAAAAAAVDAAAAVARAASATRRMVPTRFGALSLLGRGLAAAEGVLDVTLGEIGTPAALPPGGSPGAPAVALEWPGHGATPRWPAEAIDDGRFLEGLADALLALGTGRLRLHGEGGGAPIARRLAQRLGARCIAVEERGAPALDAAARARFLAGLPPLEPVASGAHFIEAWNWARLRRLFVAGAVPDAAAVVRTAPPPPRRVHGEVVEMLRAGGNFGALWRFALREG
jgi:pimeloyl-ACP methyl ester carboxylesterase